MQADLVVLALGGVQRFIGEARTTADVAGASEIVQRLARKAAQHAHDQLAELAPDQDGSTSYGLVIPTLTGGSGLTSTNSGRDDFSNRRATNKIVVLTPPGHGKALATELAQIVQDTWRQEVESSYPGGQPTPGFPDVSWVCVSGSAAEKDYQPLWVRASEALAARRRVRAFTPLVRQRSNLCAQAASLPAGPIPDWEKNRLKRQRAAGRRTEFLSVAGWVKRRVGREDRSFPSTLSVASITYRRRLLKAAESAEPTQRRTLATAAKQLEQAVRQLDTGRDSHPGWPTPPGLQALAERGSWVWPERWNTEQLVADGTAPHEDPVQRGRDAAAAISRIADQLGVRRPSPYYAVVVQDLDWLGKRLRDLELMDQRNVSTALARLAEKQLALATELDYPAVPVYAGGDDFLAFAPAASALELAKSLRTLVDQQLADGPLGGASPVTASSAVVFAHMTSPLQEAIGAAQKALAAAKNQAQQTGVSRDALAVVVRRRGGERARLVQPWRRGVAADELRQVAPQSGGALSPGLASRLEADQSSFAELVEHGELGTLNAELRRLVKRQGGSDQAAQALLNLARHERSTGRFDPVPAALVARFLTQECQ